MVKLPNPFPGKNSTSKKSKKKETKIPKAGFNGTLVAIVIDESGSMMSCVNETISGFNEFVSGQKLTEGNASLKVNKFEGGNIVDLWGIKDINDAPPLSKELYRPNGMTNLNDAIGKTILEIDTYLSGMKKKERPAVLVMIMTDGHENSSREYNSRQIKEMVKDRETADWGFTFVGANIDAFAAGNSIGMTQANTMQYNTKSTANTFKSLSQSATRFRSAKSLGTSTEAVYSSGMYTSDERLNSNGSGNS